MARGTWSITIGGSAFGSTSDIITPDDVAGGPQIQTVLGYGAAAPVFINQGNWAITRAFTMTREHSTDTDAHNWFQTAIATWAGVATVVLSHTDYESVASSWTIAGAKIEIQVAQPIGLTTITKIKITGGAAS